MKIPLYTDVIDNNRFSICFYDGAYRASTGKLVDILFDWVDKHDCFLIIKSKTYWYARMGLIKRWSKNMWRRPLREKISVLLLGRFPRTKAIWNKYPKYTLNKLAKLVKERKVVFRFKRQEHDWALRSDVVVAVPEEAGFEVSKYRDGVYVYWYKEMQDKLQYYRWRKKNVTLFIEPEKVTGYLDKEYSEWIKLAFI